MRAVLILASLACLAAGCASASETPGWFEERQAADAEGYPNLREVPRGTSATTDPEHWSAVEADLRAAANEVFSHPRAAPAAETVDPAEFLEEARRELEETRQAHQP